MKKMETKIQHCIPRTYLKNFAFRNNDEYFINMLGKEQPYEMLSEKNIINICAVNHLHSLKDNSESKQKLEDIYTDIFENNYDNLFSVLTDDDILEISDEQKKSVVSAIVTIFYRTKKWNDFIHPHAHENLKKIFQLSKHFNVDHYFDSKGVRVDIKNKTLEELQISHKNITRIPLILTQLKVALNLIEAKQFDHINVYKIADDSEFITSDNPVIPVNINNNITRHFDIGNAYYLPISTKYLIAIFPKEGNQSHNRIIRAMINKEWVDSFNSMQLFNCDNFIIGSEKGLKNTLESQD